MSTTDLYVIGALAMVVPACLGFFRWRRSIRDGKGFPVPHELLAVLLAGLTLVFLKVSPLLYSLAGLGYTAYMAAHCLLLCPSPAVLRDSLASRRRFFLILMGMMLAPYLLGLGFVLYITLTTPPLN